jgi:two-component system chemotaxis response regulator CheB
MGVIMPARELVVVGTSMGGVEALVRLVRKLPAEFPAALLVVEHLPPGCRSRLPEILSRAGPLAATHPRGGESIIPGHIYIAPPDYHLLVEPGRLALSHTAHENRFRPSIDPLFRSAARHYGTRVIAILLSGGAGDGIAGLLAVRNAGGVAVVQHPDDAYAPGMPQNAIQLAGADYILPVAAMAALLERLVGRSDATGGGGQMSIDPIEKMSQFVDRDMLAQQNGERPGQTSVYSCPECGGVLWQVDQKEMVRFRCHVGHAYYAEQLLQGQAETLEAALWSAVRMFRERSTLAHQLAQAERSRGNAETAGRYQEQGDLSQRHGEAIQQILLNNETGLFPPSTCDQPQTLVPPANAQGAPPAGFPETATSKPAS